jgi:diguanylate cyclase (GGDEF)-like protein/PAS domain S-box-containing protein
MHASNRIRHLAIFAAWIATPVLLSAQSRAATPNRKVLTIAAAIAQRSSGDTIIIAGRATASTGALQSTVFDIAVQDSTGGIRIFSRSIDVAVIEGDSVVATGVIKQYRGSVELVASGLRIIDGAPRLVVPAELPIDQTLLPQYDGHLVRARGRVAGYGTSEGGQWLRLRDMRPDATGTLTIWVPSNHGTPVDLSRVRYEDSVVVTGVMTRYQDNPDDPVVWQVVPRTRQDVHVPEVPQGIPAWMLWTGLFVALATASALAVGRWASGRQLRALRETEVRYRQLLELSPDAVVVFAEGQICFANPAAAIMLGVESENMLSGRSFADFVEPDFRSQLESPPVAERGKTAPRLRGQLRSSTGRTLDVEVTASPCRYVGRPAIVVLARDITQQLRFERDLHALALVDELTGLGNRRGFMLFAEQERIRARRDKRVPVIVFADIDGLKAINDAFGHAAGDSAIRLVAQALKSILRESDIVARWGGDEFVALIGEGGEKAAEQISQRLAGAIAALRPAAPLYRVSASVGISPLDTSLPLTEALEKADAALYESKRRGNAE